MSQQENTPRNCEHQMIQLEEPHTTAGVKVEDWQVPGPHLLPEEMARLIAAVSSVTPSPFRLVRNIFEINDF